MANGLLGNLQPNGLLGPVTMNPNIAAQGRNALASTLRGTPKNALLDPEFYSRDLGPSAARYFSDPENSLRALSLAPVPVLSDVAGLAADALMYKNKPQERNMLNFGLTGLGMLPLFPALAGMTAYHGSPYKFDKFDAANIGKGEGAQAYGHGMYYSESPKVAQSYANELGPLEILHNGKIVGVFDKDPAANAAHQIRATGGDVKGAIQRAERIYSGKWRDDVVSKIRELGPGDVAERASGSLYKVDIPDEYIPKMLDWDKPLSQQPEILKAINNAGYKAVPEMTGGQFIEKHRGEGFAEYLSNDLRKAGIPGIRYLDGGSRGTGQGTSNFVVFPGNEGAVKILERK